MPPGAVQYDPRDTQPLGPGEVKPGAQQPLETPASITAPPPAQITDKRPSPRENNPGPVRGAGAVAFMADNILKGFAQGRQQSEMKKIANMKRTVDGQQFTYQLTAQNLKGLVQQKLEQGADPKTVMQDPEIVKAAGMRDASWAAWMKSVGQMQGAEDGGKKPKKGKAGAGKDAAGNPIAGVMSQDPQEKAQAWYQIAVKAGPPDRFGLNDILSQRANNDRQTLTKESASALNDADLKSSYDKLFDKQLQPAPKVSSTITTSGGDEPPPPPTSAKPPGSAPVASMQPPANLPSQASATATDGPKASSVGAIPPATPGATPTPEATPAQTIPNAPGSGGTDGEPPSNLSQLEQRQLKDMREEMERRGMIKPGGGDVHGSPRMGAATVASEVPEGAIGVDGNPLVIDRNNPHEGYKPIYYANGVTRWQPFAIDQQLKNTVVNGQVVQSNYDKTHGTLDTKTPIGKAPVATDTSHQYVGVDPETSQTVLGTLTTHKNFGGGGAGAAPSADAPHKEHPAPVGTPGAAGTTTTRKDYSGTERRAADRRAPAATPKEPVHPPLTASQYNTFNKQATPTRNAGTQILGDPNYPGVPSLVDSIKIYDDPKAREHIGTAMKLILADLDAEEKSRGTLTTVLEAGGNFDSAAKRALTKQTDSYLKNMPQAEQDTVDLLISSMGGVIGTRASTGASAAKFSADLIEREIPIPGATVASARDGYVKLEKLAQEILNTSKHNPLLRNEAKYYESRMKELDTLAGGHGVDKPPGGASGSYGDTTSTEQELIKKYGGSPK